MGNGLQSRGTPVLDFVKKEATTSKLCSGHTGNWSVKVMAEAWGTGRTGEQQMYWLLIGLGFLLLIWNRTLLCVSPWVDYHSEMFLLLCLPLHSSYFLESPTVISLNMKTAYFCLIVLLICKIPSSSERQDDYCECMESFYHEKRVHWFTYYTYQPATW